MKGEDKRRLEVLKRRETDVQRWANSDNLRRNWDRRAPFGAALCADSKAVCDIGCGNQALRTLLPPHIKYLPVDLVKRTDDTLVCDLNKKELPEEYLKLADTVTLLGVIEYIYDAAWVLRSLAPFIETLVISYNPADMLDNARDRMGWANGFKLAEFGELLVANGYVLRDINMVDAGQVIFKATVSA